MFVTPTPRIGDVVVGRDAVGRVLRISAHPDSDRVVLSIWQEGRCLATVRLAAADVDRLVAVLEGAAEAVEIDAPTREQPLSDDLPPDDLPPDDPPDDLPPPSAVSPAPFTGPLSVEPPPFTGQLGRPAAPGRPG
jgi:hypothetical protein